jgi:hypothetical protein
MARDHRLEEVTEEQGPEWDIHDLDEQDRLRSRLQGLSKLFPFSYGSLQRALMRFELLRQSLRFLGTDECL